MAQMAGVFSELERKMIGQRTSDALQALKANGKRLGRRVEIIVATSERIVGEHATGASMNAIAKALNEQDVPTARGSKWHGSTIKRVLESAALDAARG